VKNSAKKLSGVTLGLMMAGIVHADTFNATSTVSSAITLVETTALDLGTLFMPSVTGCAAADAPSFLTMTASTQISAVTAGTVSCDDIVVLAAATYGVITVTGAAPFGSVNIAASNAVNLTHSSGNPALPPIVFTSVNVDSATASLDLNGDAPIIVGGVFTADDDAGANADYVDGIYTGTYDIDVTY